MYECESPYASFLPFLNRLNITVTLNTYSLTTPQIIRSNWWFNLAVGEDWLGSIPNKYLSTRGSYLLLKSLPAMVLACLEPSALKTFHFSLMHIIKPYVWLVIVIIALTYSMIYKSFQSGFAILWTLIGISIDTRLQKRQVIGCLYLWMFLISLVWQSHISSESFSVGKFPIVEHLVNNSFQLWTYGQLFNIYKSFANSILGSDITLGKTSDEFLHDINLDTPVGSNRSFSLLRKVSREKLLLFTFHDRNYQHIVWEKAVFVNKKYICQSNSYNPQANHELKTRLRMWGFEYAITVFRRWYESGFLKHGYSIHWQGKKFFHGLSIRPVEGFLYPVPLQMKSVLGVGWLAVVSFESVLFVGWILTWILKCIENKGLALLIKSFSKKCYCCNLIKVISTSATRLKGLWKKIWRGVQLFK